MTAEFIKPFKADIGLIGISGLKADALRDFDFDYGKVKVAGAIIERSRAVWVAAEHSPLNRPAMVELARFGERRQAGCRHRSTLHELLRGRRAEGRGIPAATAEVSLPAIGPVVIDASAVTVSSADAQGAYRRAGRPARCSRSDGPRALRP